MNATFRHAWRRVCGLALGLAAAASPLHAATVRNARLELQAELRDGEVHVRLTDRVAGRTWADGPGAYALQLTNGGRFAGLQHARIRTHKSGLEIVGDLGGSAVRVTQELVLARNAPFLEERITLNNRGRQRLDLADLGFGFRKQFGDDARTLRWVAVPYRRQVDGKLHDYSTDDLLAGRFSNSSWRNDASVADQELSDQGKLRSEAWAWTDGQHGLLIAKYNQEMIEYSVAGVEQDREGAWLRFGGAGLALYREPRPATRLPPGGRITFGLTRYTAFDGDWRDGYAVYHAFLNEKGHALPRDYAPPLNWNELFDVGWYHSNREQLFKHYTREALFKEAAKARDLGCDLLYLDPGWEICEGTTLWDEERFGKVADFTRELKQRFGLKLGYRTIGRVYRDEFPKAWYVRREDQTGDYQMPRAPSGPQPEPAPLGTAEGRRNLALLPEAKAGASTVIDGYPELHTVAHLNDGYYNNPASWVSAQDPSWVEIDLGAAYWINEIALGSEHRVQLNDRAATQFDVLAATEYASASAGPTWRKVFGYDGRPVHATEHFRFEPVSARWVRLVIRASAGGSARIDELEIYEATPAYFRQGFTRHRYQENWGFEFMWDPIADLRSGRALCLYYYNLGCEIPLYDHITMEGDNDACLSFWWYASTVRHLGVGGKKGLNSPKDNQPRYDAYRRAVAEYNRLRPFYARGRFVGLDETAHLHVHPTESAAVLNVFNLTDAPTHREVRVNLSEVGLGRANRLIVEGCPARREDDTLALTFDLPSLTAAHALIRQP